MSQKLGITADRCELNRQIKADNALLRELKSQIQKLMQAVKSTVPALAKAMEAVRENLTVICYQLGHIRRNKPKLSEAITVWKTDLTNYKELVQRIKDTKKERRSLIAQKKETSGWNLPKQKELSGQIAELAELLEELQSEKLMLLESMSCEEDNPVPTVQKTIKALEKRLATLETKEDEYTDAMEQALQEYASLQIQAKEAKLNPVELYMARMALRTAEGDTVAKRIQQAYGDKYSPLLMSNSRQRADKLLNENAQTQVVQKTIEKTEISSRHPTKRRQDQER